MTESCARLSVPCPTADKERARRIASLRRSLCPRTETTDQHPKKAQALCARSHPELRQRSHFRHPQDRGRNLQAGKRDKLPYQPDSFFLWLSRRRPIQSDDGFLIAQSRFSKT